MIPRYKAIEVILDYVGNDDLVLSTIGMMSREVSYLRDRPGNFYMIGSMRRYLHWALGWHYSALTNGSSCWMAMEAR